MSTTNNNDVRRPSDLTDAELRRLVDILLISHPQAVASAMTLLQQSETDVELVEQSQSQQDGTEDKEKTRDPSEPSNRRPDPPASDDSGPDNSSEEEDDHSLEISENEQTEREEISFSVLISGLEETLTRKKEESSSESPANEHTRKTKITGSDHEDTCTQEQRQQPARPQPPKLNKKRPPQKRRTSTTAKTPVPSAPDDNTTRPQDESSAMEIVENDGMNKAQQDSQVENATSNNKELPNSTSRRSMPMDAPPSSSNYNGNGNTTNASTQKKKKRPPGKKYDRTNHESQNSGSPSKAQTPILSTNPPLSESVTASGTQEHQVIPWQADKESDDDDDDADAIYYCFDGYSAANTTRAYQDISLESFPHTGCYLLYESQGGGKLVLHYSKVQVPQAIGFFRAGDENEGNAIPAFKFTRNHGRVELIGNCAAGKTGRKNYYSGWCQFIRAAKDSNGLLFIYPLGQNQGLDVDIYVLVNVRAKGATSAVTPSSVQLPEGRPCCVSEVEAIACMPKNAEFFPSNMRVDLSKWTSDGNASGVTIQFNDGKKPFPSMAAIEEENLFVPGMTKESSSSSPPEEEERARVQASADEDDPTGCYLLYDDDGFKLIQQYSKTKVPGAIGFIAPGWDHKIPGFKFKNNQGRSEIIGNCSLRGKAGRKNYCSGWCQFVRLAKTMKGDLWIYPPQTQLAELDVDIYSYSRKPAEGMHQTVKLAKNTGCETSTFDAVACLPKHSEFFDGLTMDLTRWVEEGSKVGAALQM